MINKAEKTPKTVKTIKTIKTTTAKILFPVFGLVSFFLKSLKSKALLSNNVHFMLLVLYGK